VRLVAGSATDQGQRRENNEDAYLVDVDHSLYAIADGMGGHRGGEVASRTAIEALRAAFARGDAIGDAITTANTAVIARAAGHGDLEGMGTTLTAVTVGGPRELLFGHVGDSRAYLLHDGELRRVTEDHSLVGELVRGGRLTEEQAEAHPQRAIVTRALGIDEQVDVDVYAVEVESGDRVIICSDGLTDMLRERDVERIARTVRDPQQASEQLVAAANDAGGEDNITVVVVDVDRVDDAAPAPEPEAEADAEDGAPQQSTAAADVAPRRGSKLRTARGVVLVLLPVLLIVGFAAAALGWYARSSYYVGVSRGEVVIYKGVPGGVLGWDPTVDERTGLDVDKLSPLDRDRVSTNTSRGSLATAHAYVSRLRDAVTTTTTSSTTTTTRPKPKTTTTRKKP
jgi:serine/threonine protein phosphatase PrpC